jgi:hypothetical protein
MNLIQAIKLLTDAAAIILPDEPGSPLLYPSVSEDDECFLQLEWTDEEALIYQSSFFKAENASVLVEGNCLLLKDDTGAKVKVQLLVPMSSLALEAFNS